MFGVVDSDTDTYLNCFYICLTGGDVWCCMVLLIVIQIHI